MVHFYPKKETTYQVIEIVKSFELPFKIWDNNLRREISSIEVFGMSSLYNKKEEILNKYLPLCHTISYGPIWM